MAAAMSVGALAYGPLDRILKSRKWITIIGTLITAASFFWLGYGAPSKAEATILLALIGAFGITYGVLMAHARQFFPAHLLGRGLTLMNMLFIGGAGIMQPISGAFMKAQADALPLEAYAALHQSFALALVISVAIYLFSRENPRSDGK
jgi:MFS family permease